MTLNVTSYGDNPQIPGISAETYIPDQLIAGNLKLVTGTGVLGGGALLPRGALLGQQTEGAPGAVVAAGGGAGGANTGNGTLTVPVVGTTAKVGSYLVKFTGATTFIVLDPNGLELQPGVALGAYSDPQISFTITAGATAFVAGDGFSIPVAAGSGNYVLCTAAATDGSQNPVAILVDTTDASGGNVNCGVYLMGEFNQNYMTFGTGVTVATAATALRRLGIFLKSPITAVDPS